MMASTSKPFAIYFFVEEAMGKIKIFRKDSQNIRAEKMGTRVAQLARAAARNGSAYNCTHKRRGGAKPNPLDSRSAVRILPRLQRGTNLNQAGAQGHYIAAVTGIKPATPCPGFYSPPKPPWKRLTDAMRHILPTPFNVPQMCGRGCRVVPAGWHYENNRNQSGRACEVYRQELPSLLLQLRRGRVLPAQGDARDLQPARLFRRA